MTVGQLETYIASHMLKKLGLTEAEFVGAKTEIGGEVLDKNTKLKGYSKAKVLKWIKNAS